MSMVWVNGTLVAKADARVSPFDHGFLYGDGVWEHFRVFGGKVFRLDAHLDQLSAAAGTAGIDIPLSRAELVAAVEGTLKANDRTTGYVRVIVSRGPGTLGPDPRKIDPQVFIIAEEYQPFPLDLYAHGLHVVTYPHWGFTGSMVDRVKFLGRPQLALAKRYALDNGCLEAVFENHRRELVCGTEGHLYVVRGEEVHTADGGFNDPTRAALGELIAAAGFAFRGGDGGKQADVVAANEAFLAGTACGVIGLVRLDGADIGSGTEGPVTRTLREAYRRLTRGAE